MRQTATSDSVHPAVRVGDVHLRVSDLDRAIAFSTDGLGFHVVADARLHAGPHAVDHGRTVAVDLADPAGNGIELAYDRPREAWWDAEGRPVLRKDRIDLDALINEPTNGV